MAEPVSIEAPEDAEWDEAWLAELERREHVMRAAEAPGSEWSEVRARLVARLKPR
jgi:hypothetical protein